MFGIKVTNRTKCLRTHSCEAQECQERVWKSKVHITAPETDICSFKRLFQSRLHTFPLSRLEKENVKSELSLFAFRATNIQVAKHRLLHDGSQCLFQVAEFQSQRQSLATCVAAAGSSCSLFKLWLLAGMFWTECSCSRLRGGFCTGHCEDYLFLSWVHF